MNKKWIGRALLAAAAVAGALMVAEAAVRLALFSMTEDRNPAAPGWNHPRYLVMLDDKYEYTLRPYFEGVQENPYGDFKTAVTINDRGMRDRQLEFAVRPGPTQVLMLGDSFTFGEGVEYEQAYPARVEALLGEKFGREVQVHNGGVPGYSLRQSLGRLGRLAPVIRPRVVIMAWLPWEAPRETAAMRCVDGYLVPAESADRVYRRGDHLFLSSFPPGGAEAEADVWLQSHSLLYFFLRQRLAVYARGTAEVAWFKDKPGVEVDEALLMAPFETLDVFGKYCWEQGATPAVVLIGSPPGTAAQIEEFCRSRGIATLSLAEDFYHPESPYHGFLFAHDGHFTVAGHEALADSVAPWLSEFLAGPTP